MKYFITVDILGQGLCINNTVVQAPLSETGTVFMGDNTRGIYTIPEYNREEVHISGPLTEDLIIYVRIL